MPVRKRPELPRDFLWTVRAEGDFFAPHSGLDAGTQLGSQEERVGGFLLSLSLFRLAVNPEMRLPGVLGMSPEGGLRLPVL